ncbi:hypothetical protein EVAR_99697_1 [Eumeta japonica]|uniref:Uncharacterized protein n=1 Tax=Eumeta variegata TaxID=151549 RepID=A0A4C1YJ79_EUMVA|nr:hypothetical protein EVAR_99697_1 [Eumeta japonica]
MAATAATLTQFRYALGQFYCSPCSCNKGQGVYYSFLRHARTAGGPCARKRGRRADGLILCNIVARLDPCELHTVVPYTYTLSERWAELRGRRSGGLLGFIFVTEFLDSVAALKARDKSHAIA